jgi:DNA-binding protein H-NS
LAIAEEAGFDLRELFGKGSKKGSVAVKYRDPKNSENTWTGRGRMPRWMAAATKGGKAKKDDFLIG